MEAISFIRENFALHDVSVDSVPVTIAGCVTVFSII